MPDVFLEWGGDFQVSATGGLLMADGDDLVRQRLERRLFTAVQGYVWHPEYGAGLPQKIGSVYQPTQIEAIVRSQINMEASVAPNPPPVVKVSVSPNSPNLTEINISYTNAQTGTAVSFTITG